MALKWLISPGQKSDWYVNLTTLPLSCDDCLEILGVSPSPGAVGACSGLWWDSYSIYRKNLPYFRNSYKVSRIRPYFNNQQLIWNFSKSIQKYYESTTKTRVTISFVISVRPSVRLELNSHWTDFYDIWVFLRKDIEKNQASLKYDKNNGYFIWRPINIQKYFRWEL